MISFKKAENNKHYKTIEVLAKNIWTEHYIPITGKPQVSYMLEKFQSASAIKQQIHEGSQYFLIVADTSEIGYISIKKEADSLFLSKLYLLKSKRGKGFGKKAIDFIETKAKILGCNSISLTVNKNNTNSIKAYESIGFKNMGAITMDIGNDFVMDDFKMEKQIV